MNAKHQFKYTYNETCIDEYSPHEITFEMPGSATLDQILYNFESYLKACGFVFDGHLDIVDLDGSLYEFNEEEPQGGCMADFDKECGCETTSSPLEADKLLKEWNEGIARLDNEQKMKCYEEALAMSEPPSKRKLDNKVNFKDCCTDNLGIREEPKMWDKIAETVKQKWVHGICNPPSPDWKKK